MPQIGPNRDQARSCKINAIRNTRQKRTFRRQNQARERWSRRLNAHLLDTVSPRIGEATPSLLTLPLEAATRCLPKYRMCGKQKPQQAV
jgi:hypothetical protein